MSVWASHKDEVKKLPDEFDVLATSRICEVEAMKHHDKPVYGIQFHLRFTIQGMGTGSSRTSMRSAGPHDVPSGNFQPKATILNIKYMSRKILNQSFLSGDTYAESI